MEFLFWSLPLSLRAGAAGVMFTPFVLTLSLLLLPFLSASCDQVLFGLVPSCDIGMICSILLVKQHI